MGRIRSHGNSWAERFVAAARAPRQPWRRLSSATGSEPLIALRATPSGLMPAGRTSKSREDRRAAQLGRPPSIR